MARKVALPSDVAGRLFLSSMPGRNSDIHNDLEEMSGHGIDSVACLAMATEIDRKSPSYGELLKLGTFPHPVNHFPIEDYGVPGDMAAFVEFVDRTCDSLEAGDSVLIHCGAGIGRTGTAAVCILLRLGMPPDVATDVVADAGSRPENQPQRDFIQRFETMLEEK